MNSKQYQIPTSLLFLIIAIAIVNGLAETNSWYWIYRWFDMPMHFAGGMWLAGMAVWWVYFRGGDKSPRFISLWGVSVLSAFSIGFFWEIFEAGVSFLTVGHMNNILDTLGDLLFDILGGTTIAVIMWVRAKLKTR